MTKLELLNVFLTDRLTAAAEEIFRAVKDAVLEYQSELLRNKEENERLRRLLSAAVQRLLLLQPEHHSVQPHEDAPSCESEWRGAVELQTRIKEEPTLTDIHTNCPQEAGDLAEGNGGDVETLPTSHSPVARSVCSRQGVSPSTWIPQEVKREDGGEDSWTQKAASGLSSSCVTVLSTGRTQRTEQQGRGLLLRSNGKQGAHILQTKNTRSLKPPPPRSSSSSSSSSSHPSQGIQRWHSCRECGKGFSFACQLEVHMRWHTKEKPYSCAVCRKSFTTVSMLKRHHRIHTGEKPFRCHVCGKCFNQSAHLNTHFRLHTRERAGWGRATHSK